MFNKRIFVILALVVLSATSAKLSFAKMCGSSEDKTCSMGKQIAQASTEHKHEEVNIAAQEASKGAVNVENKICPVSGENIDETLKVAYEYEGKAYNFCCASCIDEFKKDPKKYQEKIEKEKSEEGMPQSHSH